MRYLSGLVLVSSFSVGLAAVPLDDIRFEAWEKWALSRLDAPSYFLDREVLIALPVSCPPANSSTETRAELDELLELQQKRTRVQVKMITKHLEYDGVCAAVLAATHRKLTRAPKTRALLNHVHVDAVLAVFHAKKRFNRARPHQLEPRLHPAIPVPAHPAYPSGHALQGYLVARTLSLLFPKNSEDLMAVGVQIGREREIAGIHYPSDAKASRALGEELFARLQQNEKFLAEVEAAKAEWNSARDGD
jgi:membrane-associated phospholipid phosphatase